MDTESIVIASGTILAVSIAFSMVGLGGGVLYVPILLALGVTIYDAVTISLFVITVMSISTVIIYHRHRAIDWKLALVLEPPTAILAFVGGILANNIYETALILTFAGVLFITSFLLISPVKDRQAKSSYGWGYWHRGMVDNKYVVHLRGLIPISTTAGFIAGMVGVSGGVFKLPAMVLIGRVPVRIAIGTSSFMVAITALAGLCGHVIGGTFDIVEALPLAAAAFVGGFVGSNISNHIKVPMLNIFIAGILFLISIWMVVNTLI
ncbi:MAG: sulfite exporter TauE/SafE family protein [Dehalococcoidia bacterium]|nr:MAG: sulfite exporter TauE/SafE family protein [Dehalococcoidia bacterium]